MRRSVIALDRVVALLAGLALVLLGAVALGWATGWLPRLWPAVPDRISAGPLRDVFGRTWWPWLAAVAGLLALLAGLRWLFAHLPRAGVGPLVLPGSDRSGRLLIDPASAAGAAAEALAETLGIRSAHSKVLRDRGELVVRLAGTMEPHADLTEVVAAADGIAADLRAVLGREDARARVQLSVARRPRAQGRFS